MILLGLKNFVANVLLTANILHHFKTSFSKLNSKIDKKQNTLLQNTIVRTHALDASGHVTISIDISSMKLSDRPAVALLQAQYSSFNEYTYLYDYSTNSSVSFWIDYGTENANLTLTTRYGYLIIPW